MASANVNPEELRRFAKDLKHFNTELETLMGSLRLKLHKLEKSWQDQEQKKFTAEFDIAVKTISRFMESSNKHTSVLLKKAHHIEAYLQQK